MYAVHCFLHVGLPLRRMVLCIINGAGKLRCSQNALYRTSVRHFVSPTKKYSYELLLWVCNASFSRQTQPLHEVLYNIMGRTKQNHSLADNIILWNTNSLTVATQFVCVCVDATHNYNIKIIANNAKTVWYTPRKPMATHSTEPHIADIDRDIERKNILCCRAFPLRHRVDEMPEKKIAWTRCDLYRNLYWAYEFNHPHRNFSFIVNFHALSIWMQCCSLLAALRIQFGCVAFGAACHQLNEAHALDVFIFKMGNNELCTILCLCTAKVDKYTSQLFATLTVCSSACCSLSCDHFVAHFIDSIQSWNSPILHAAPVWCTSFSFVSHPSTLSHTHSRIIIF